MRRLFFVLGIALVFRALVFFELRDSPILYLDRWTETDNAFYDDWAQKIVAGDVLSVHDVRPFHSWHGHVARAAHEAAGSREPFTEAVGRRIWDEWLGARTFYQDPLYPYFLAALYATAGRQHRIVFAVQSLLSLLAIALLWDVTRRLFDETTALIAGLAAAVYGPLVLYENVLLRTVLINTTGIVTLWLAMRAFERPSARRFLLLGVAGALGGLATSSSWIFVVLLMGVTPIAFRREPREAARAAAALAVGVVLGLSPVIARNVAVHVPPFSLAATGAITFINHNAADYHATQGTAMSTYAADILPRSHGQLVPAVVATIRTHASVGHWLGLLVRKFFAIWTAYEIPNNESYDYFLMQAPIVAAVGLGFGAVAPLALVGIVLGARRSRAYLLAVAYIASGLVSLVLLYTLGRLRLPTAFLLIPFAANAIVAVARRLGEWRWRAVRAPVGFAAALALAVHAPLGRPPVRVQDYGVANEIALHLASQQVASGQPLRAVAILDRQVQTEPEELREVEPSGPTSTLSLFAADLAGSFSPVHRALADVLDRVGAARDARRQRYRSTILETIARGRAQQSPSP